MLKVNGIVNFLKTILKYSLYLVAVVKILETAISTLEAIGTTEETKKEV